MKKFISMVMAAAMVVSLVPATAFAANTATFKVVGDKEYTEAEAKDVKKGSLAGLTVSGPEIQLKVGDVDSVAETTTPDDWEITLDFNGAEIKSVGGLSVGNSVASSGITDNADVVVKEAVAVGDDSIKLKVVENSGKNLDKDDIIAIDVSKLNLVLTKASAGAKATVEVGGDFGDSDKLTFASVLDDGIKVTLKKVADVTEEETTKLEKDMTIEAAVGKFVVNQEFKLTLSKGFEFTKACASTDPSYTITAGDDDDEIIVKVTAAGAGSDKIVIKKGDIEIDAASAKVGDVAKITVKAQKNAAGVGFKATAVAVEAAKVIAESVSIEVDEDEDVPVIYSGVNVRNYGITDDSDHKSLEVTIKEAAKGSLDVKKSFTLTLPEGVYATDVNVTDGEGTYIVGRGLATTTTDVEEAFAKAYKKGDQECFEFARKTFVATDDSSVTGGDDMELKFELELIAEPGFEGDVTLTLGGDAFENEAEVVIAKFVSPYTVEAAQNDLIIDYRNTAVPTAVVVKEAEAGLWAKDEMKFDFRFDRPEIQLEDDATFTVDDESGMELKSTKDMQFTVKTESDDEAAVVTISDISLYMGRSIAAGAYDLEVYTDAARAMMTGREGNATMTPQMIDAAALFTAKDGETGTARTLATTTISAKPYFAADFKDWKADSATAGDFVQKGVTVKEGFVNVITAGRDQDDASFTKKVVVPVGEKYIVAGEETVTLDVPAYISAAGYTMLPVRAVAVALGINNNNVLWDQATKTVTILYGQRIITMVAGQKVVYVNGSAIPASASVEIKDGRTFLPMRDLATALGVTDITWDAATKTATLNGNR